MKITEEILKLVKLKKEGNYWDFKREPHENNIKLLHDIISLSNSLHNGNRYLIIGVSDPKENCEIIGLDKEQKFRKSQAELVDFLRTKKFAGDIRPEIELLTIKIENKEIDVIVIFDKAFKPYYLTEVYREKDIEIRANYIYTRITDTNTPIDKSADINIVEKMWKQRFGIEITPIERFIDLLKKNDEWKKIEKSNLFFYHKYSTEFRIDFTEPTKLKELFCYFFANKDSFEGIAKFSYKNSILFEIKYVFCDGKNFLFPFPKCKSFNIRYEEYKFYYFCLDDDEGILLKFLLGDVNIFEYNNLCTPFLVFKNKEELEFFSDYLLKNLNEFKGFSFNYIPNYNKWDKKEFIFFGKSKLLYEEYIKKLYLNE